MPNPVKNGGALGFGDVEARVAMEAVGGAGGGEGGARPGRLTRLGKVGMWWVEATFRKAEMG